MQPLAGALHNTRKHANRDPELQVQIVIEELHVVIDDIEDVPRSTGLGATMATPPPTALAISRRHSVDT